MVRPVRIQNFDFCQAGIASDTLEVFLDEEQIIQRHRQAKFTVHGQELLLLGRNKVN